MDLRPGQCASRSERDVSDIVGVKPVVPLLSQLRAEDERWGLPHPLSEAVPEHWLWLLAAYSVLERDFPCGSVSAPSIKDLSSSVTTFLEKHWTDCKPAMTEVMGPFKRSITGLHS